MFLMTKLSGEALVLLHRLKGKDFLLSRNESLRPFSSATASALADSISQTHLHEQTNSLISQTQMQNQSFSQSNVSLDPTFYISALLSCRNIYQVRQVHALVAVNGLLHEVIVANKLLYIYAQLKALIDAYGVFSGMKVRDSVSWSVMVGGFAKNGDFMNCLKVFREIIRGHLTLDNYTLPLVIRACRDKTELLIGRLIHDVVLKFGLESDHYICAALVDMYAKCRMLDEARKLFDKMPERDLVTWTVIIGAYAEGGMAKESLILLDQMVAEGIVPDKIATVTIVNACAKLGSMQKAAQVHEYIWRMNFSLDVILGTAMIDMHAKCGNIDAAREIFDSMREKNVISWSAMIAAYGYHGQGREALDLFQMMLHKGIAPNRITFVSLLYACSHSGLVEEGLKLFNSMWDEYSVRPNVKHYTCMIDLFGRAGRLDEAKKLIESMTVEKDAGLWVALLGACRIHKNVELAEKAAKSLLELQPENPSHYILLSNVYATAGKRVDVANIRNLMMQRRLKKIPGYTWIDIDDKTHQFSVGDRTHPWSKEIYSLLKSLNEKFRLAGYVPDTNFVLHDVDEDVKLEMLSSHSEKLAIAYGLIATPEGTPIRITKNLRVCGDCHTFCKFVSAIMQRVVVVRDANRFHHFKEGVCSCRDYW